MKEIVILVCREVELRLIPFWIRLNAMLFSKRRGRTDGQIIIAILSGTGRSNNVYLSIAFLPWQIIYDSFPAQ